MKVDNSQDTSFEVMVLGEKELAYVSGGTVSTQDTHCSCDKDGVNDTDG